MEILTSLLVSVLIYFGAALGLVAFGRRGGGPSGDESLSFSELLVDEAAVSPYAEARFEILPGVTHMGVVVGPEVRPVIQDWLTGLGRPGPS